MAVRVTSSLAVLALSLPASAAAETINVTPAPHAIQMAINGASAGDTLRIHAGVYRGAVKVNKRLTLKAAGDGRPVVDGNCATPITIDVQHAGVTLTKLIVRGASKGILAGYAVNFFEIATGTARGLVVEESCNGADAAEYGINVFGGGNITLVDNRATGGFTDAGIYVGGIEDTRGDALRVIGNLSRRNNRGIIIEDSSGPSVDIRVRANRTSRNTKSGLDSPTGIFVRNSDGGMYAHNFANGNGKYGIHLDEDSDRNRLYGNVARHNAGRNYRDQGSNNCGGNNTFSITPC